MNPTSFVPVLEGKLSTWDHTEDANALQEAIDALKNQQPLRPLAWRNEIAFACRDHCEEQGPAGLFEHDSPDGRGPSDRVAKYCNAMVSENMSSGMPTAKEVLAQLIIDHNVPSRGHRVNLFCEEDRFMGMWTGPHKTYETMTVQNFSSSFSRFV